MLGEDFARLHPQLRRYFGAIPRGFEGVGSGSFREAGLRVRVLRPMFAVLGRRRIAFAERGTEVPFRVRNRSGPDGMRVAARTFHFSGATREMSDVIRVERGRLVDRIGTDGEIEVELALRVTNGRLLMRSRRLALRVLGLRLPLPPFVTVTLEESAGERGVQQVVLRIVAPLVGEIYGYAGTFTYAHRPVATEVPVHSRAGDSGERR
ncbi:hypothetical protein ARHIZOSPH14_24140 [Agromyces rhizosphaerae]|uniref:DUF4166 domain-containing protein n=1 Tax=Agromyces rhizosphaerae TaxID=88374 RepID=A0A9W6FRY8_9MICO|nr:hypothetical protein ARHIZOSPH14_24140 [Agromyces rhizosphaerae]